MTSKAGQKLITDIDEDDLQSHQETDIPIVLLHGTTGMLEDWSHVLGVLSKYRTVIRPDYGAHISEADRTDEPSMSDYVADVIGEIRGAGIPRFDLVGASLGAAIATCVASEYPHMVKSVVLQSGFLLGKDPRLNLLFNTWLRLARTDKNTFTKLILASGFSRSFLSAFDEPTLDGIIENFIASGDWARIEQAIQVDLSADVREQARSIKVPTLVVTAKHDQIVPPEYSYEMAGLIPHATTAEVDAGHLTFLERPLDLANVILRFLDTSEKN